MKNYELVCILDPQLGDGQLESTVEKYQSELEAKGAEIAHIDRWGLRKLAYGSPSFKGRQQGYYVLYQFSAEAAALEALEHDLKFDEGVLRHLFVAAEGPFVRVPQLAPDNVFISVREERFGRGGRSERFKDRGRGAPRTGEGDRGAGGGKAPVAEARDAAPADEDKGAKTEAPEA